MIKALCIQAMTKFFAGLLLMGPLLFLPAGTAAYPEGWRLIPFVW